MAAVRSRFSSSVTNAKKKLPLYDEMTKKDNRPVWARSTPRVLVSLVIINIAKLIMLVAGISALLSIAYFYSMAWYNGLSVRDPCAVAQFKKGDRQRLLAIDRDLTNTISDSLISDASVDVIPATFSTVFVPTVPKIIHQQWKSDVIPEKFMKWKNKWLQYFPENEYKHMLWTDDNAREHIVNNYPWFLDTYDGYPHNINRVDAGELIKTIDIWRLWLMM
jgi:mannosyltransferase OCH1-like enzyme